MCAVTKKVRDELKRRLLWRRVIRSLTHMLYLLYEASRPRMLEHSYSSRNATFYDSKNWTSERHHKRTVF